MDYDFSGACFAPARGNKSSHDVVGLPGLIILLV